MNRRRITRLFTAAVVAVGILSAPIAAAQAAVAQRYHGVGKGCETYLTVLEGPGVRTLSRIDVRVTGGYGGYIDVMPAGSATIRVAAPTSGAWAARSGTLARGYPGQTVKVAVLYSNPGPDLPCAYWTFKI